MVVKIAGNKAFHTFQRIIFKMNRVPLDELIHTFPPLLSSRIVTYMFPLFSPESSVHTPDWQPSIITGKCGQLEDKEVECNSTDVDEALGLDLEAKSEMEDPKTIDAENRFCKDDEHIYHELEVCSMKSIIFIKISLTGS